MSATANTTLPQGFPRCSPTDVDVLVPEACEYVISYGKEDTVSVIKFEILR